MKWNQKIGITLLAIASVCCEPAENKEMEKLMLGEWYSHDLKINMNSFKNKDTVRVFEVNESEWERKMNIRPIKTVYFENGTYISEHRNLRDSVIFRPAGKWNIAGTIISIQDTFPELGPQYSYTLSLKNNMAEFLGLEDCDNDGTADDDYFGRLQRK